MTDDRAKRHMLTMRVSEGLRDRIKSAAEVNGRSVSQEIESRLEQSFNDDRIIGSRETSTLTKLITGSIALIEIESGKPWTDDRMTWEAVNAAVSTIVQSFQPPIDLDIWDQHRDLFLTFFESVHTLSDIRNEIEGLSKAYPSQDRMPTEIIPRFEAAWENYGQQLATVREHAKLLFEGPLKEHEARRSAAIIAGKNSVASREGSSNSNFTIAGAARMYAKSGAFEPLKGLSAASDYEVLECIRQLAGYPEPDPPADANAFETRKPNWLDLEGEGHGDPQT